MNGFLDMGQYAGFIWLAYSIALVVLVGVGVGSRHQQKKLEAELAKLQKTDVEEEG
jgi:heme exporter protein CcmD